ncbi:DUF4168 domain-containing protein [Leptodesmis sichuanensis]|uniref:DUF4168 domain-containing protein n=2 Tax=Leptodesmis TaxID=2664261 RepID=UPI001F33E91A|nr:DUF4168 domain-containing protein [Leptodesmis sichuanensis]
MFSIIRWFRNALWLLLTLVWGFHVTATAVLAQELPTPPLEAPLEQPALTRLTLDPGNIPSEKVSQFVYACLQVVKLIENREGELQAAETESESLRIEQEIEAEALAIIEKAGLTRQEYLQLLGLANTDPEFGERVAIQLQEASG